MNKKIYAGIAIIIAGFVIWLVVGAITASAQPGEMHRKIVVFDTNVLNEPAREALLAKFGEIIKIKNLDLIDAKVVLLPPKAEKALRQHPGILRIDDDVIVEALVKGGISAKPAPIQSAEKLPWGVNRIDADLIWDTTTGESIKVAIVDTGIDIKHPDLLVNIKGGINTINSSIGYNDDNGHGTHVAGIIGAIDNTIGVIGVGPKINLYAVKALNRNGSGYLSDIIEGLDWAIAKNIQVVNMSLGTTANIESFHDAVKRVNQAGIVQVAAVGNNGGAVNYPAAYPEVIAVSATDSNDTIASWSSRGPEVDLAAPGVNIYSTYKGTGYATLSATSMASPHVAGVAALVLTQTAKCDIDSNGSCSPLEVQQRLQNTAEWLSGLTSDQQGSGLVDAEKAVMQ